MRIPLITFGWLFTLVLFAQEIPDNPNRSNEQGRQGTWTILYDKNWNIIEDESSAEFYRIISYEDDKPVGAVRDFFLSGQLQMVANLKNDRPLDVFDGLVKWYYENGELENIEVHSGERKMEEVIALIESDEEASNGIAGVRVMADLYHDRRMAEARPLYKKLVTMTKKQHGENSLQYADALRLLAWDYLRHTEMIEAEPLFFQAKSIIDSQKGQDIGMYISILNDIGDYYTHIGRHDEGLNYFNEALPLANEHLSKGDYLKFVIMHNSASCYRSMGDFEKARELSMLCVEDARQRFGKYHRETANTLWSLSDAYFGLDQREKGREIFKEVVEIYAKLYGLTHPEYLDALYRVAIFHLQDGNLEEASKGFKTIHQKYQELYGDIHPRTNRVLRSYAFAQYRIGRKQQAIKLLRKSSDDNQTYLHRYFDYMNEDSRTTLYNRQTAFSYFQSSLTATEKEEYPELVTDLLNMHLRNKAILISTTNAIKKRILESNDRKLIELYNEAQELKQTLESLRDLSDEQVREVHGLRRDSLFEVLENRDRDLNRLSSFYSVNSDPPKWQAIRDRLGKGEALVELRRYQQFDLSEWNWTPNIRYMAFVVTAKTKDQPEMVFFENGNELEEKGMTSYANSIKYKLKDTESYNRYWKPLESVLKKYDKIYFSSDGIFHKINLQTLRNPKTNDFLFEEKDIQLVTSGRDLLEEKREPSPVKLGMLLGNPSFGDVPEGVSGTSRGIDLFSSSDERSGVAPLPGAENEVNSIGELLQSNGWRTIVLTNDEAEESALKDMLKPNILHLATHGFFDQNQENSGNPLHNTGLLFTGATKTLLSTEGMQSSNDGVLTSFEALNLNIDNTDLVVLSACETGLGEIRNGEGIYGLQRAIKIAGARTIIMSLWKVDDAATKELMKRFYTNRIVNKMDKRTAFTKAQNNLKEKFPHPYYWGAFVILGE